jgi:hypothetical protein
MKVLFILWCVIGLTMVFCFGFNLEWAGDGLLAVSISASDYLSGTALNVCKSSFC